jgi:hypothetical protein
MYEHAYQRIIELTEMKIYVTINDDGYNDLLGSGGRVEEKHFELSDDYKETLVGHL